MITKTTTFEYMKLRNIKFWRTYRVIRYKLFGIVPLFTSYLEVR